MATLFFWTRRSPVSRNCKHGNPMGFKGLWGFSPQVQSAWGEGSRNELPEHPLAPQQQLPWPGAWERISRDKSKG